VTQQYRFVSAEVIRHEQDEISEDEIQRAHEAALTVVNGNPRVPVSVIFWMPSDRDVWQKKPNNRRNA
jgi:hypothetical protein